MRPSSKQGSFVSYVATHYSNNVDAPAGNWACAPTSKLKPFDKAPSHDKTLGLDLCGQCVSYVKRVCPSLPPTSLWRKGKQAKNGRNIVAGTVIATFDANGHY